jgi:hypothetical protein
MGWMGGSSEWVKGGRAWWIVGLLEDGFVSRGFREKTRQGIKVDEKNQRDEETTYIPSLSSPKAPARA